MSLALDRQSVLREILALTQLCHEFLGWSEKDFSDYMSFNGHNFLFSMSKMPCGGSVWSSYVIYKIEERFTQVFSFGTHPDFRRQRLAFTLLDQMPTDRRTVIWLPQENEPAAAFLNAIGFERQGEMFSEDTLKHRYSRPAPKA